MGCSSSKLVASDDGSQKPLTKEQSLSTRPRQARLSLAGTYNQVDTFKVGQEQTSLITHNGERSTPLPTPGNGQFRIKYSSVSQRGYYPDQPTKINQDAVLVVEDVAGKSNCQMFGVFDGHGEHGTECALFAAQKVKEAMNSGTSLTISPEEALHKATVTANEQLHASYIDDSLSGTTACLGFLIDNTLYVANVGDSRAVLAEVDAHGELKARDLTHDQTPFRADECDRVRAAGAQVLTLDQVEGIKDAEEVCWTNENDCDGDPPRLWAPGATYPGTAFTRSIGDSAAEAIGVFAEPEVASVTITKDNPFVILASDGVWEFIPSQRAIEIVKQFSNPQDAANALVASSYKAWLQRETRTDDISVVILYFELAVEDQQQ